MNRDGNQKTKAMIKLNTSSKTASGFADETLDTVQAIIQKCIPNDWGYECDSIQVAGRRQFRVLSDDGSSDVLQVTVNLHGNGNLESIDYRWDGNESTWQCTPITELCLQDILKPDIYGSYRGEIDQNSNIVNLYNISNTIHVPDFEEMQLIMELEQGDNVEYDGMYDINPTSVWNTDNFESIFMDYGEHAFETIKQHLKQNKITRTHLYTLAGFDGIELVGGSLFLIANNGMKYDFDDLSIAWKIVIAEELLYR